jgi:hypothetical protein
MAVRMASRRANQVARSLPTSPSAMPIPVSRVVALSARSRRRYSARAVNIRYGSVTPCRHQIVDHHADIAFGPVQQDQRLQRQRIAPPR